MPTHTAADNYTAVQVAALGGVDSVWEELSDRLWSEHLGALRDGRPYVVQIRRHAPSPVLDTDPPQHTYQPVEEALSPENDGSISNVFEGSLPATMASSTGCYAVRAYYCLANPWMAEIGEIVDASCMPRSDIEQGPPISTIIAGRRFVRTDEGWERVAN